MTVSFRAIAILSALVFFALGLIWMLAPELMLLDWGVDVTPSAELVGRRAAAPYVGFALMFWSARNAQPSAARSALIKGVVLACFILAALGVAELDAGNANPRILIAVAIELVLALALMYVGCARPAQTDTGCGSRKA